MEEQNGQPGPITKVERIHSGFLWGVATMTVPPAAPGLPPRRQRILKFANQNETDVDSYPLTEVQAQEIAQALTRTTVPVASADALRDLSRRG